MAHLVRRFLAIAAAIAMVAPVLLHAQARERVAFVTLVERSTGQPRTEVSPADVVIREDGTRREVLRVTRAAGPLLVAVLVDNSAAAEPAIPDIRRGLTSFVEGLGGVGPVTLVTMADRPTLVTDYTTSPERLAAGIGRIFSVPNSGTTLLDAVLEAADGILRREEERAAIVLVSVLGVETSTLYYMRPLGRLKQSGAALHAVVLNPPGRLGFTGPARQRDALLDRGVRETGGFRRDVLTSMAFSDALAEVARVLTHQFRVVYARPQTLIPPENIEVAAAQPGFVAYGTVARGQTP
jgi:hypothetical protein